jgi:hypothetical protein
MKKISQFTSLVTVLLLAGFTLLQAAQGQDSQKEFPAKKEVRIKLVISGCELTASSNGKIQVFHASTYDPDQYEARMEERGDRLYLEEKFFGNDNKGDAHWKVAVPPGTEVEFNSATGDLTVTGFDGELEGNSGTGDLEIEKSKGEFDLNSGTGSVLVNNSSGEFDLNSGTGTVRISDSEGDIKANSGTGKCQGIAIKIRDDAEFNSGTGTTLVEKPMGDGYDLSINSGTGDAVLDMDGAPLIGYFEFKTNLRSGDIDCPVEFDEEVRSGRDDNEYIRKSFTREKSSPRYFISTGTGTAELKL